MAIVIKRRFEIEGNYTDEQKEILQNLINLFRETVNDVDPSKNILDEKKDHYTNSRIIRLLNRAMQDINGGQPPTKYNIYEFAVNNDNTLIVDGAVVFALLGEGLLQVRNQVDFNDSGLSIGLFNKTQLYQNWYSMLLQQYLQGKQDFKRSVIVNNQPSMFVGISSEYARYDL